MIISGRNVATKVRNQMVAYFISQSYLTITIVLLHYLANTETRKNGILLTQMLYYCFSMVQPRGGSRNMD